MSDHACFEQIDPGIHLFKQEFSRFIGDHPFCQRGIGGMQQQHIGKGYRQAEVSLTEPLMLAWEKAA